MKVEVRIWIGGQAVNEVVIATNYQHAKEIVLTRNPKAKVIGVNAIF
tara:strand:+ start:346 stop:486 length:141 start_codon:yes stop_codon:yes gene_type:complete